MKDLNEKRHSKAFRWSQTIGPQKSKPLVVHAIMGQYSWSPLLIQPNSLLPILSTHHLHITWTTRLNEHGGLIKTPEGHYGFTETSVCNFYRLLFFNSIPWYYVAACRQLEGPMSPGKSEQCIVIVPTLAPMWNSMAFLWLSMNKLKHFFDLYFVLLAC